MKFKPGEKIKCIRTSDYNFGNVYKNKIYTFDKYDEDDGLYIKRRITKKMKKLDVHNDYNWFDEDTFISAEPELFHQQLENLTNET